MICPCRTAERNYKEENWFKSHSFVFHFCFVLLQMKFAVYFFYDLLLDWVFMLLSSPGAAQEADYHRCTPNSSNSPALFAWRQTETEQVKFQPPATRVLKFVKKYNHVQTSILNYHYILSRVDSKVFHGLEISKLIFHSPQTVLDKKNKNKNFSLTWSPLLSVCSLSKRKKEISFGGRTELKWSSKSIKAHMDETALQQTLVVATNSINRIMIKC